MFFPGGFEGETKESDGLVRMSIKYCRTLGAALLNGDYTAVNLTTFLENDNSLFAALNNGTMDALTGRRVKKKYNLEALHHLEGLNSLCLTTMEMKKQGNTSVDKQV